MIKSWRIPGIILFVGLLFFPDFEVSAGSKVADFEGKWVWALYADDKSELPPAYRNLPLEEVPIYSLDLGINQKGNKLKINYSSSYNYQSRVEVGDVSTTIYGNTADLKLESGFGGRVLVRLTVDGERLHWVIIRQSGENFFHSNVVLSKKQ